MPQSEVPLERAAKTQPFPVKPAPLARMTMTPADIATVTPELEAACRKLMEGVQLGGPYLPVGYKRLRVQFPGNHGGVNWGGDVVQPAARLPVREHERARTASGLTDRDPKPTGPAPATGQGNRVRSGRARTRGVPGGGRFKDAGVEHDVPAAAVGTADRGQRPHRRVRVARAARRHRQPAARQAEDRPARQRRIDCHGRRPRLRRRDRRRRFRAFDARTGKELWTVKLGAAAHATPSTYLGTRRQAVRRHHRDRRRRARSAGRPTTASWRSRCRGAKRAPAV